MDTLPILQKRFSELASRAALRGVYTYTDFLTIAESDTLRHMKTDPPPLFFGGYDDAERTIARFGSEETAGYTECFPIACVEISPVSKKFADPLTHRDFLGSVLALGIKREVCGDILVCDTTGYLFCLDSIAPFIASELVKVKHTDVVCKITEAVPEFANRKPDITSLVVASERQDALVAAVFGISRSESRALFECDKVFVNGLGNRDTAVSPLPGSIVSVRGLGRFIYEGINRETRKGRLRVDVRIY